MTVFVHTITALSRFFGGVAAAMVVTSLALVCDMVVMQYALGVPAPWPSEIVSYLIIGMTFLGTPYVFAVGRQISFALPARRVPGRFGTIARAIVALLSLAFAGLLFIVGLALLAEAAHEGWRSDDVAWIALWIPYLSLPLGAALLALECLAELAATISAQDTGGESVDAEGFAD